MENALLRCKPKMLVLSGPSGFLGSRVLDCVLRVHRLRKLNGLPPGECVLLSSSPGRLMQNLSNKYGPGNLDTVRASRVDYYSQHDIETWKDHLGSLGLEGEESVFLNLAAVAGPVSGKPNAMMDANYRAPIAAAKACESLGFGHFIQSSTQATNVERAGQVFYAKSKVMADFELSRLEEMAVTIAALGVLYCKTHANIGQSRAKGEINLIDLALLPLTPIMGSGLAPLQPQEVLDAAERLAFLALSDPNDRPHQTGVSARKQVTIQCPNFRYYDAVGPETMSITELLQRFAEYQGNKSFRPVHIGYENMERILDIKHLGNLNRQFVSLLRSEQDSSIPPLLGDHSSWETLLGPNARMLTLDQAFIPTLPSSETLRRINRSFPYITTIKMAFDNPRLILPGISLGLEILRGFVFPFKKEAPA